MLHVAVIPASMDSIRRGDKDLERLSQRGSGRHARYEFSEPQHATMM